MTKLFATIVRAGGTPDGSNDDLTRDDLDGFVWSCPVDRRLNVVTLATHGKALLGDLLVGVRVFDDEVKLFLSPSYPVFDEPSVEA